MTQRPTLGEATKEAMGLIRCAYNTGKLQPSDEQKLPEDDTRGPELSTTIKDGRSKCWHLQDVNTAFAEFGSC